MDVYFRKIDEISYPAVPCNPGIHYPEFSISGYMEYSDKENQVYDAVRSVLANLGFDSEDYGTDKWNPFRDFIKKGQKVLIKPNMVFHEHPYGEKEMYSMVTNAAVIRPIIDYILLATDGDVEIIIGDCPVQTAIFSEVARISGIDGLLGYYKSKGIDIGLIDMRMLMTEVTPEGIKGEKKPNPTRRENDYICVDLKDKSELVPILNKASRLEITDYKKGSVQKHHTQNKNEYMIPREVLEADVIINMPKLKTHRKAGMTCAMKNLVGVNGDKTCIAHHTRGDVKHGGDEFSRFALKEWFKVRLWTFLKSSKPGIKIAGKIKTIFQKYVWKGKSLKEHNMVSKPSTFSEGSWSGNDTIWRCVKDLNKIILYADKRGNMQQTVQRKYLCIVDAVLAGEGEGPMEQTTKKFGVVFGGTNPVYVDYVATKLMKFDYKKIPTVFNGFDNKWWNIVNKQPDEIVYAGNVDMVECAQYFTPTYGWQEHLKQKQ